jgi:uncharacterized protein (TIGR02453 family)
MKKDLPPFDGFSEETINLYSELAENNHRDWFHANKKRYEKYVRTPAKSLIAEMAYRFPAKGLPFIADIKKSMFRPNRDIRFSKNKDPYKTHLGIFFPYTLDALGSKPINVLGLYFHIEENSSFVAGGIHTPPGDILKQIRMRIANHYEEYEDIINDESFRSEFPDFMESDRLKRMPQGFDKYHPAAEHLKQKQFIVMSEVAVQDTYSAELADLIERKAVALMPFLEYFHKGIDSSF